MFLFCRWCDRFFLRSLSRWLGKFELMCLGIRLWMHELIVSHCTCCSINDPCMLVWLNSGTLFGKCDSVLNTASMPAAAAQVETDEWPVELCWNMLEYGCWWVICLGWGTPGMGWQWWNKFPPQECLFFFLRAAICYPHMYSTPEGWGNTLDEFVF